jgi:hypothetical protein
MSEATVQRVGTPTVNLPPGPGRNPALGVGFALFRRPVVARLAKRYGPAFTLQLPVFGPTVLVTDSQLAKQLFAASTDDVGNIQPTCRASWVPDRSSRSTGPSTGAGANCSPRRSTAKHQELRADLRRGDAARSARTGRWDRSSRRWSR